MQLSLVGQPFQLTLLFQHALYFGSSLLVYVSPSLPCLPLSWGRVGSVSEDGHVRGCSRALYAKGTIYAWNKT